MIGLLNGCIFLFLQEDDRRTAFISKIGELFMKLASYAPVDLAADQLGMNLIHSSLPPVLTDGEVIFLFLFI